MDEDNEDAAFVVMPMAKIGARMKAMHEEFIASPRPAYSKEAFDRLWDEVWTLREKLLLAQGEYVREHGDKADYRRLYYEKIRDIKFQKNLHAQEVANLEADIGVMRQRLRLANEKIEKMKKAEKAKAKKKKNK